MRVETNGRVNLWRASGESEEVALRVEVMAVKPGTAVACSSNATAMATAELADGPPNGPRSSRAEMSE